MFSATMFRRFMAMVEAALGWSERRYSLLAYPEILQDQTACWFLQGEELAAAEKQGVLPALQLQIEN